MRTIAVALAAIICAQTFCAVVQQTHAAPPHRPPLPIAEVADSDNFLRAATSVPRPVRDNSHRVADLLARMTLEEKVGQMTQLAIGFISTGDGENIQLDQAKLDKAVVKYGAGSI